MQKIAVVAAGTVAKDVAGRVAAWPFRAHLVDEAEKYDAMRAATVALATSGTVSTELALAAQVRRTLALYEGSRDMIELGAHQPGINETLDKAIEAHPGLSRDLGEMVGRMLRG